MSNEPGPNSAESWVEAAQVIVDTPVFGKGVEHCAKSSIDTNAMESQPPPFRERRYDAAVKCLNLLAVQQAVSFPATFVQFEQRVQILVDL